MNNTILRVRKKLLCALAFYLITALPGAARAANPTPTNMTVGIACQNAAGQWYAASPSNPCATGAGSYNGNGTLSVTTSSAPISTMTVNAASGALPAALTDFTAINTGSADAAICVNAATAGATCTCPGNGAAATNGITLPAGKGGYTFILAGVPSVNPTVVACSSTVLVQFQW